MEPAVLFCSSSPSLLPAAENRSSFVLYRNPGLCPFLLDTALTIELPVTATLAYFHLYKVGRIVARITRRTECALCIVHRLPQSLKGHVAERICAQKPADLLWRVR